MKTIVIVHTENASRRRHFEKAREYDAKLILVKNNPTWEKDYVDDYIDADTRNITETVSTVVMKLSRSKIDGIVTFVEHSVPTAAAIAKELGLRFISETTAQLARDKYEMRKAFSKKGIACPKYQLCFNLSEAKKICKDFGYPVVLKPIIGGGSMYVRRINDDKELLEYFPGIQKGAWEGFAYDPLYRPLKNVYNNAILIESYIDGGEFSVESIVSENRTSVIAVQDKPLPMIGPYFDEIIFSTPSRLSRSRQDEAKQLAIMANEALGINIGAAHTEFRLDSKGPVILETAARMAGGPSYRTILTSTKFDMVNAVMDLSVGKKVDPTVNQQRPTCDVCFFAEHEGILKKINGVNEARQLSGVIEVETYKKAGDEILVAPKIFQAHGHFIASADSFEELDALVVKVGNMISMEVEPYK